MYQDELAALHEDVQSAHIQLFNNIANFQWNGMKWICKERLCVKLHALGALN